MSENTLALLNSLTPMQRAFVVAKLDGASMKDAAIAAGYSKPQEAYQVIQVPAVAKAIEEGTRAALRYDMGPSALRVLAELANDGAQSGSVRAYASKSLSALSGYAISQAAVTFQKDVADMSADELGAELQKLQAAMAAKARDITPVTLQNEPIDVPDTDQDVDLLG